MNTSFVRITDPLAAKRSLGWPLSGRFATTLPVDKSSVASTGFAALDSGDAPAPAAPRELDAALEANLRRYELGKFVTEEDRIERRLERLGACDGSRAWYRRARESFALAAEHLAPSPVRDAVYAEPDAIYPWDGEGALLDAAHARVLEAEAKKKAAAEEAARIAALPNAKTFDELGVIGVLQPDGSTKCFRKPLDLRWPESFTSIGIIRPGTDVIEKLPEVQTTTNLPSWMALRRADNAPIVTFRDGRSAEGEHAERCFRKKFAPHMQKMLGIPESFDGDFARADGSIRVQNDGERYLYEQLFVQMAARGFGLSRELAWSIYVDEAEKLWKPLFRTGVRTPARDILVDADGDEVSEARARDLQAHASSANQSEPAFRRVRVPAVMHETAPLPLARHTFDAYFTNAAGGANAWFSGDELYTEPPRSFIEEWATWLSPDRAWKKVVEKHTAGKNEIRSLDLEAAIVRANLCEAFGPKEHERLTRLMQGWTKTRRTHDGEKATVWLREGT